MKSLILTSTKDKLGQKQRAMLHVKGQAGAGDHQHVGSPGWRGGQTPRTPKEGAGAVDSRATAMWMVPGPPTRGHETHTLGLPAASGLIRPFHRGLLGTVPTPPTVPRNEGDRGWGTSSPVPTDQVPPTKETGPLSQDPAHIPGLAGTWPMFRSRPRPSQGALALLSLHCTQRRGRSTEHISTRSLPTGTGTSAPQDRDSQPPNPHEPGMAASLKNQSRGLSRPLPVPPLLSPDPRWLLGGYFPKAGSLILLDSSRYHQRPS